MSIRRGGSGGGFFVKRKTGFFVLSYNCLCDLAVYIDDEAGKRFFASVVDTNASDNRKVGFSVKGAANTYSFLLLRKEKQ